MNFREYQAQANQTSAYAWAETPDRLVVGCLGLAGEAGEVSDLVKKYVGHGHELNVEQVIDELGDVLWYVAEVASSLGLDLSSIADANLLKLNRRYPGGFDPERSRERYE
jgi:NTP pyrophosphatase (non-canonical NTP hydrolase)